MPLRIVLDTNVLFEGITMQHGVCHFIIQGWDRNLFQVAVSNPLLVEYEDVLSRKLAPIRWQIIQPILGRLVQKAHHTHINYSWRPTSPDPSDDFVIDCVMNSNAYLVTYNLKDFRTASKSLGFTVLKPIEFVRLLTEKKS